VTSNYVGVVKATLKGGSEPSKNGKQSTTEPVARKGVGPSIVDMILVSVWI
jgi:hypothetical protein